MDVVYYLRTKVLFCLSKCFPWCRRLAHITAQTGIS